MKFLVERTSMCGEKKKPCKEAFAEVQTHETTGYDKESGLITKNTHQSVEWYVEINSLEELVKFSKKYGRLVVDEDSIEIYDDYRE